jgi:hypothetical protein
MSYSDWNPNNLTMRIPTLYEPTVQGPRGPRKQTGILKGETRWRDVANRIGIFALASFVILGTLACLIFIPGAPLYAFAGTMILLGLTGSLTGAAAVSAAVGLTVGTFIAWNGAFAAGSILGEKKRHEEEMAERIRKEQPGAVTYETGKDQNLPDPGSSSANNKFKKYSYPDPDSNPVYAPNSNQAIQNTSSSSTADSSTSSSTLLPKTNHSNELIQDSTFAPPDSGASVYATDDNTPSRSNLDPCNNEPVLYSTDEDRYTTELKQELSPPKYGRGRYDY